MFVLAHHPIPYLRLAHVVLAPSYPITKNSRRLTTFESVQCHANRNRYLVRYPISSKNLKPAFKTTHCLSSPCNCTTSTSIFAGFFISSKLLNFFSFLCHHRTKLSIILKRPVARESPSSLFKKESLSNRLVLNSETTLRSLSDILQSCTN